MSPAGRKRPATKRAATPRATAVKAAGSGKAAARARPAERRGRGRPTDHDSEQTRDAILAAAVHRFGHADFASVSMEALASDCDLNVRAIYYHFASKRGLYDAAADAVFGRYGQEVIERVFGHDDVRARVAGYVEVHRVLHATAPDVLPFIGRWLVELQTSGGADEEPTPARTAIGDFLGVVVDDAVRRGEVHPDLDRDGARLLLAVIGTGLALGSLGSLGEHDAYPAMLDALDLLNEGTLFTDARSTGGRRPGARPRGAR